MKRTDDLTVAGEASDAETALKAVRKLRPDVAVVNLSLPRMNGLQWAEKVSRRYPHTRMLVLSMHTEKAYVTEALRLGGQGARRQGGAYRRSRPGSSGNHQRKYVHRPRALIHSILRARDANRSAAEWVRQAHRKGDRSTQARRRRQDQEGDRR